MDDLIQNHRYTAFYLHNKWCIIKMAIWGTQVRKWLENEEKRNARTRRKNSSEKMRVNKKGEYTKALLSRVEKYYLTEWVSFSAFNDILLRNFGILYWWNFPCLNIIHLSYNENPILISYPFCDGFILERFSFSMIRSLWKNTTHPKKHGSLSILKFSWRG